tara:strand:- start:2163 stop:3644 length:1482 start_codon:yes stop_codon:yes gene_type:complete
MSFLDGMLIRNNLEEDTILKQQPTVESIFYETLEANSRKITNIGWSMDEVRDEINQAKKKYTRGQLQLDRKRMEPETNRELTPKPHSDEITDINNTVIMSALWQIHGLFDEKLFRVLQEIFAEERKPTATSRPMDSEKELVFNKFLDSVEKDIEISHTLQNKMHEQDLLTSKFLLVVEDITKRGKRLLHPRIVDRLVTFEAGKLKETELYAKAISILEELVGAPRPDRDAMIQELKHIMNNKSRTAIELVDLLITNQYRYRGAESKEDFNTLRLKLDKLLEEDWDEALDLFYRRVDVKNTQGKIVEHKHHWGTQNLDDELLGEWESLKRDTELTYEEVRGKKYLKAIYMLETEYYNVKRFFKAYKKLKEILLEQQALELDVEYNINQREDQVHAHYKAVTDHVNDYNKYKKMVQDDIRNKTKQQKEFIRRRKQDSQYTQDTSDDRPAATQQEADKLLSQLRAMHKDKAPLTSSSKIEDLRAKVKELKARREEE